MKTYVIFLVFALACVCSMDSVTAGEAEGAEGCDAPSPEELRKQKRWEELSPNLRSILTHLGEANVDIKTLQAAVNYTRAIPILDEEEKSSGTLVFKKPDLIALQLGKPRSQGAYSDGSRWWVVDHKDRQVEIYKVTKSSRQSQEAAFLQFAYGQSARDLVGQYDVSLVKTKTVTKEVKSESGEKEKKEFTDYRLKFVPASEDAPARYSTIEIWVTDHRWLPHVITLHESEGEIVHEFDLQDIEINEKVKDRVFTYEPPRGYRVVRPGRV